MSGATRTHYEVRREYSSAYYTAAGFITTVRCLCGVTLEGDGDVTKDAKAVTCKQCIAKLEWPR